jgi:hypothetical protein
MESELEGKNLTEEEMKKLIADLPGIIRDLEREIGFQELDRQS